MEEIYRIGKHEFATREEWEGAQRDVEKIASIVDHLDIDDPEVVEDIYNLVREGRITFESKLGTVFFCDISDRVAQNLKDQLEENEIQWARERHRAKTGQIQKKLERKEDQQAQIFKMLGIGCAILAALCMFVYGHSVYSDHKAAKKLEELQQQKSISQALDWYTDKIRGEEGTANAAGMPQDASALPDETRTVLPEYSTMYSSYPDLVGWLRIEDTQIDLPVMQTTDNAYYLNVDINGAEDVNGTLFMDCRNDFVKPSTNLIIYGHNMKSGAMFGGLKQYLDEAYTLEHSRIQFDTIYERQTYEVIAVCLSQVGYEDDGAYRYYNFIEAESEVVFEAFLDNIRNCAVYDRTQDVTASDSLLTLSTCNSYVEDGRLFIVAKKIG